MKIQDPQIRQLIHPEEASISIVQDGKITKSEGEQLVQAALDGGCVCAAERRDLNLIMSECRTLMSDEVFQALSNVLAATPSTSNDDTAPPFPGKLKGVAFELAPAGTAVTLKRPRQHRETANENKPMYLGIEDGYEVGTSFELINLSSAPGVTFNDEKAVIRLDPTGHDVSGRDAGIFISKERRAELGLRPGDIVQVRAVDIDGNRSAPALTSFDPAVWAIAFIANGEFKNRTGSRFEFLDGDERKLRTVVGVTDLRPPVFNVDALRVSTDRDDGVEGVRVFGEGVFEPGTKVVVVNTQTGEEVKGRVGDDRRLDIDLGKVDNGTPLVFKSEDKFFAKAAEVTLVYDTTSKNGVRERASPMATRLQQIIPDE